MSKVNRALDKKSFFVAVVFAFLVSCAALPGGGLAESGVANSPSGSGGRASSGNSSSSTGTTYTPLYVTFGEAAHVTRSDSFTAMVTVGRSLTVSNEDNGTYIVNNGLDVLP